MFNKICKTFILSLLISQNAFALTEWEGNWIYGRYNNGISGRLIIKNCQNNKCEIDLGTFHGAHVCSFEGIVEVNNDKALYTEEIKLNDDEPELKVKVEFTLNREKNTIVVTDVANAHIHCGMRGYFEGEYENENNPLRYPTSFNCWAKNLNQTEITICASEDLSKADLEVEKYYKTSKTAEWYKKRNQCLADEKCLWDFYVNTIKNQQKQPLNLYNYFKIKDEKSYVTEQTLMKDYLYKNMSKEDYEMLSISLSDYDRDKGDNFYFFTYGRPGLYTIYEAAFYLSETELWIAFLSHSNNSITIYSSLNKSHKDIPPQLQEWIDRLISKGKDEKIILKEFTTMPSAI